MDTSDHLHKCILTIVSPNGLFADAPEFGARSAKWFGSLD